MACYSRSGWDPPSSVVILAAAEKLCRGGHESFGCPTWTGDGELEGPGSCSHWALLSDTCLCVISVTVTPTGVRFMNNDMPGQRVHCSCVLARHDVIK